MKKIIFISLLTTSLFAEHKGVMSDFSFTKDIKEQTSESGFGKTSTFSLLFARHELTLDEKNLHFYYGAKMGVVSEEYASDNGFGIPLNEMGTYFAAAVGMEYDLNEQAILLAEGIHAEDHLSHSTESKVKLTYTYTY